MKYHDLLPLVRRGVKNWLKANGIEFFTLSTDFFLDKKAIQFLRKRFYIQFINVGTDTSFTIIGKRKIKTDQFQHIEDSWIILHERPDKDDLERVSKKLKPWLSKSDLNLLRREHERQRGRHRKEA